MKTLFRKMALVLSVMSIIAFASPICLCASDLNGVASSTDGTGTGAGNGGSTGTNSDDSALSDYMRNYTPITEENMQKASVLASPIANVLGTITGGLMIIAGAGIFLVTACDLIYIGLPFTRSFLNPQPVGGMGGGMPMGGMGMGGMGGMGGAAQQSQESGLRRKWVSDEAIAAVALGQANAGQGGAMGMPGGMGMGMGMRGGMMGGMGAMGGQQPQMSTKSIIFEYLKKRTFFIIIFAVASVVLMSSVLTDCGINIAELLLRIFEKFNGSIANVQVQ